MFVRRYEFGEMVKGNYSTLQKWTKQGQTVAHFAHITVGLAGRACLAIFPGTFWTRGQITVAEISLYNEKWIGIQGSMIFTTAHFTVNFATLPSHSVDSSQKPHLCHLSLG